MDKRDEKVWCREWVADQYDAFGFNASLCFDTGLKCLGNDEEKMKKCDAPGGMSDFIHFNGQKRGLFDKHAERQGIIEYGAEEVEEVCGEVCGKVDMVLFDMTVLRSQQYGYMHLDDVCLGCK